MGIYIANIPYKVKEEDLKKLFEPHGTIKSVKILTDSETGRSRGLGFVHMQEEEDEPRAIAALNGYKLLGRELTVKVAHDRNR